ncbi:hypothetical protein ANME2D_03459 [Candidatus Methanoperedens nitroreducens]|uniref:Uncharacterized protein n=1 Tax=Candidatus Methanoperedens nitratireducens TaxID=1392998 RepID=A0A062V134_9EURY|nr:hypothetical protein ANME2D_03459 [Candidatus Methanoperedens nitroreducens]
MISRKKFAALSRTAADYISGVHWQRIRTPTGFDPGYVA